MASEFYHYRDQHQLKFKDPGGRSALGAASHRNPRNLPCPTCRGPNLLTPQDVNLHYQCDPCANRAENEAD